MTLVLGLSQDKDARAILAALRTAYGAARIVEELVGR